MGSVQYLCVVLYTIAYRAVRILTTKTAEKSRKITEIISIFQFLKIINYQRF
jgi:hypothetical protein